MDTTRGYQRQAQWLGRPKPSCRLTVSPAGRSCDILDWRWSHRPSLEHRQTL